MTFGIVIWIAPTEEIRVLAVELQSNFVENDLELWHEPTNKIPSDAAHEADKWL